MTSKPLFSPSERNKSPISLSIIRDTYTALYDEATASRTEIMEIAIVALIILEVIIALFPLVHG